MKTISVNLGGNAPGTKFDTELGDLRPGDKVIVETANGAEWGIVATPPVEKRAGSYKNNNLVLRRADAADEYTIGDLAAAAERALRVAAEKIAKHKLPMKPLTAHYTFDGNKVLIQFFAENRVDFRELVRDLASTLRARIELRQVGSRDEVKIIGALGPCGMQCCCARFRGGAESVTIKMARNQNISLNPQKINGICGRLLCCLAYENEHYAEVMDRMPRWNSEVTTPDGRGIAQDCNCIRETVNVKFQSGEDSSTTKCYKLCDCKCKHVGRRDEERK